VFTPNSARRSAMSRSQPRRSNERTRDSVAARPTR
jgi:hypothetical protein